MEGIREVEGDIQRSILMDDDAVDQLRQEWAGESVDVAVLLEVLDEVIGGLMGNTMETVGRVYIVRFVFATFSANFDLTLLASFITVLVAVGVAIDSGFQLFCALGEIIERLLQLLFVDHVLILIEQSAFVVGVEVGEAVLELFDFMLLLLQLLL